MKPYIKQDPIFAMAKLTDKYADKSITGEFGKFIYFSKALHSVGPRIKFYGGPTNVNTNDSPSFTFDENGAGEIIGDPKIYPNIKNKTYVNNVRTFINKFYPLLLLVWYGYIDEADLNHYFEGDLDWSVLLSYSEIPHDCILNDLETCKDVEEVNQYCKKHNLYTFPSRR